MQPLMRQTGEETRSETSCSDSVDLDTVFEGRGRTQKRKFGASTPTSSSEVSKKCRLDDLTVMEGCSSSSAQAPTPSNGIIGPMKSQVKSNLTTTNHFHHAGKSTNTTGYGAKPCQAKKLVIKNFKGQSASYVNNTVIILFLDYGFFVVN